MSRLLWVAVGAAAAVAGARKIGLVGDPAAASGASGGSGRPLSGAAAGARAALRAMSTAAGAARTIKDVRREFSAGMAEREQQLRDDLLGDVDVDALRAARAEQRAARAAGASATGDVPPAWHDDADAREAARAARARRGWADEPTDDPDDAEGELPYAFY
ncbi:MAG TPA: hypothetical protein VGC57_14685 [Cellulomonas sp.]